MNKNREIRELKTSSEEYDIVVQCPQCLSEMGVSLEVRGNPMACAVCGCVFVVPLDGAAEAEEIKARKRGVHRWKLALRYMSWLILATGIFLAMSLWMPSLALWPVFLLSILLGLILLVCRDGVHGTLIALCSILVYSLLVQIMPRIADKQRNPPAPAAGEAATKSTGLQDSQPIVFQKEEVPAPPTATREATSAVTGGHLPLNVARHRWTRMAIRP